ncbi:MAG TPA: hypothetical protein PKY08_03570 [Candidatus Magasanikbacteria bacterium]|nr:hypothetical protein [Candidatus Magasanikbacteria bacterium]
MFTFDENNDEEILDNDPDLDDEEILDNDEEEKETGDKDLDLGERDDDETGFLEDNMDDFEYNDNN